MRKRLLLVAMLVYFPCVADMICIENMTNDDINIKFQKGAYTIYQCIPEKLGTRNVALEKENIKLKKKEQFLIETEYNFCESDDICGFYINGKEVIDIMDSESEQFDRDDFFIRLLDKNAAAPLSGEAFFADRTYRITRSISAPSSPKGKIVHDSMKMKRSLSDSSL